MNETLDGMDPLPAQFAADDKEAEQRADRWVTKDPFQDVIPRALLSASDVYDYVRVTGMVYPFYPERLKDSSYKVPIRGEVIFWEEDGARHDRLIDEGSQSLELKPNSITFAQVEPHFRLPHYIALLQLH